MGAIGGEVTLLVRGLWAMRFVFEVSEAAVVGIIAVGTAVAGVGD